MKRDLPAVFCLGGLDGKGIYSRGGDFYFGMDRKSGRSHQTRGLRVHINRRKNLPGQDQSNNRVIRIVGVYGCSLTDSLSGFAVGFDL
jgi:hypothetical protein